MTATYDPTTQSAIHTGAMWSLLRSQSSTMREHTAAVLDDTAAHFDVDAVTADFTDAVRATLPDGWTLNDDQLHIADDAEVSYDETSIETLREELDQIDFWAIAEQHRLDA